MINTNDTGTIATHDASQTPTRWLQLNHPFRQWTPPSDNRNRQSMPAEREWSPGQGHEPTSGYDGWSGKTRKKGSKQNRHITRPIVTCFYKGSSWDQSGTVRLFPSKSVQGKPQKKCVSRGNGLFSCACMAGPPDRARKSPRRSVPARRSRVGEGIRGSRDRWKDVFSPANFRRRVSHLDDCCEAEVYVSGSASL